MLMRGVEGACCIANGPENDSGRARVETQELSHCASRPIFWVGAGGDDMIRGELEPSRCHGAAKACETPVNGVGGTWAVI